MRSTKTIHVVSCHAEGEVGDVIVGGVAPPPGDTLWEQRKFIEEDETLRNFVLNEPRGGVYSDTSTCWCRQKTRARKWASSSWNPQIRRRCPALIRFAFQRCCWIAASCQ